MNELEIFEPDGTGTLIDMPAKEYHAINGWISFHGLDVLTLGTPLECRWKLDHPSPPTRQMLEGSAIHQYLMEGRLEGWGFLPSGYNGRTKEGKAIEAELQEKFGKQILGSTTYADILTLGGIWRSHPVISDLILPNISNAEASVFWRDKQTGVQRKSRFDIYCESINTLVEIKTTENLAERDLQMTIARYGYHRQMAYYGEALASVGLSVEHNLIVWLKRSEPYDLTVWRLPDLDLAQGYEQNRKNLDIYADCLASDNWPGAQQSIIEKGLPLWATRINEERGD